MSKAKTGAKKAKAPAKKPTLGLLKAAAQLIKSARKGVKAPAPKLATKASVKPELQVKAGNEPIYIFADTVRPRA